MLNNALPWTWRPGSNRNWRWLQCCHRRMPRNLWTSLPRGRTQPRWRGTRHVLGQLLGWPSETLRRSRACDKSSINYSWGRPRRNAAIWEHFPTGLVGKGVDCTEQVWFPQKVAALSCKLLMVNLSGRLHLSPTSAIDARFFFLRKGHRWSVRR